jgi:hypothetical protein
MGKRSFIENVESILLNTLCVVYQSYYTPRKQYLQGIYCNQGLYLNQLVDPSTQELFLQDMKLHIHVCLQWFWDLKVKLTGNAYYNHFLASLT